MIALIALTAAQAAVHDVIVTDNAFDPPTVVIAPGDSVRWIFFGTVPQSTTSSAGQADQWDSGLVAPNLFYERVFSIAGKFVYYDQTFGADDGMGGAIGVSGEVIVLEDNDGDGLSNVDEIALGTDPNDPDTDDDKLDDNEEVTIRFTDPLDRDTDGDKLEDGEDVAAGASPLDKDTDDDNLSDFEEVRVHGTAPNLIDTDFGGVDDGVEVAFGTDPLDPTDDVVRPKPELVVVGGSLVIGVNDLVAGQYGPNTKLRLMKSLSAGNLVLMNQDCPVQTGLGGNPVSVAVDRADAGGMADFTITVPVGFVGTVHLQAMDEDTCTVSNVLSFTFP